MDERPCGGSNGFCCLFFQLTVSIEAVAKLQFCNSNLLKIHVSSDFSPQALA
jgi:hypothetical protein